MVLEKRDFNGSKDFISGLPDPLIGHILSFLSTKEAASTSVLSTKWRYLFVLVSNLDFDDSVYFNPRNKKKFYFNPRNKKTFSRGKKRVSTSFMDFVDRVLALQGNSPVHKFSLKIEDGENPIDPNRTFSWILNVLQRGVLDLDLHMDLNSLCLFPSEIFMSETLLRLRINNGCGPNIDVEDVYLPKLKSLYLDSAHFVKEGVGLTKLLSGCHMLEDLVVDDIPTCLWDFSYVSVTTLKRLTYGWGGENTKSVSFDTPNLVYLEIFDTVANKYPKVNFDSLVEAKIDLRITDDQICNARFKEEDSSSDPHSEDDKENDEEDNIANATDFIMGICNVKILYLSASTLEVLTQCCEAIPLFNNLIHLTIESEPEVGWESLPGLLKNSPNLETLVLLGLYHRCGDVCLCKPCEYWVEEEEEEEAKETPTFLSSSPVKVLKIMKFRDQILEEIDQVKYFLETMPNLEQLILYYDTPYEEEVIDVSAQLQYLPKVASSKCNVQRISDHFSLSSTVPSSLTKSWLPLP